MTSTPLVRTWQFFSYQNGNNAATSRFTQYQPNQIRRIPTTTTAMSPHARSAALLKLKHRILESIESNQNITPHNSAELLEQHQSRRRQQPQQQPQQPQQINLLPQTAAAVVAVAPPAMTSLSTPMPINRKAEETQQLVMSPMLSCVLQESVSSNHEKAVVSTKPRPAVQQIQRIPICQLEPKFKPDYVTLQSFNANSLRSFQTTAAAAEPQPFALPKANFDVVSEQQLRMDAVIALAMIHQQRERETYTV